MKKVLMTMALALNLFGAVGAGDHAAAFSLSTLDGSRSYTMEDFKGEVVLLNLWASWCDGCKQEMPEFFALQKGEGSGFRIVTVNIDKHAESAQKFLQSVEGDVGYKTPFVTLYDQQKQLPKAYGAAGMPSSYLIDKDGVVRRVIVGSLKGEEIAQLKREIDALK